MEMATASRMPGHQEENVQLIHTRRSAPMKRLSTAKHISFFFVLDMLKIAYGCCLTQKKRAASHKIILLPVP